MRTLLLNVTYEPLKVISWKRAVTMLMLGKVEVIEEYDDQKVRSVTIQFQMPSVVRMLQYVKQRKRKVKFCRANVYARDKYKCQFCGKKEDIDKLTYDHLIPKSRGGKTEWTNIVTACKKCNDKKGNKTPKEARMKIFKKPIRPEWLPIINVCLRIKTPPETWKEYLYWFDDPQTVDAL